MSDRQKLTITRAFSRELDDLQAELYAFIRSRVQGSRADDVLQEANLEIWNKRHDFVPGTNFRAWAYRIARFKILAEYRDRSRERLVFLGEDVQELMVEELERGDQACSDRMLIFKEIYKELPDDAKALLTARYEKGQSLVEYAETRGMKADAAHKAISRLRQKLHAKIQERLGQLQHGQDLST